MNKVSTGLLLTMGKIILSVGPSLLKLAKTAKFAKVGLAGVSMAAYSYIFTWEFAAILLLSIIFHEYGHMNAMHKHGIKTKGIYLIPFFGGAAVASEDFGSQKIEAYVALMGPVYGLFLAIITGGIYFFTGLPLFAGLASFMALINLFNLLPIFPLDGGRVLKTLSFSLNKKFGLFTIISGFLLAITILFHFKIWLLIFIVIIGAIEIWSVTRTFYSQQLSLSTLTNEIAQLNRLHSDSINEPEKTSLSTRINENKEILKTLEKEFPLLFKPIMTKKEIGFYFISYIMLTTSFILIIYASSTVEGADSALKIIQDQKN